MTESGDQEFWDFLDDDVVKERMMKEQVGPDLIHLMTDEELTKYISLHGERLRVRKYLKDRNNTKNYGKRESLLNVLREKIETRRNKKEKDKELEKMREPNKRFGNKNAEKEKRKIEIGWIHKSGGKSVQVRSKKGGGTRKLTVMKDASKSDLLKEGKGLFFPNGISSKGTVEDFNFDLWDYQDRSMEEGTTVGDMYQTTKIPLLRFYLASIESDSVAVDHQQNVDTDTDSLPELHVPTRQVVSTGTTDILSEAIQIAGIDPDDTVTSFETVNYDQDNQDIGNNLETSDFQTAVPKEHILVLHRGQVMRELIDAFKTIEFPLKDIIKPQMILPNGEMEAAEDAGGVTRDTLTEFWNSFYTECTLGNQHKVPCLRHDFGEQEWTSVAKIIAFGWQSVKYFPIHISPVFMQYCMFGTFQDDILESFMKYVSHNDAETLKAALKDVDSVDQAELDDIFTQHELRRVPRQANMERILREMAHKEILQAAMFVIDCWGPILRNLNMKLEYLLSLYNNFIPTPRRVNSLLKFPESMCADATTTSHHLKRFIRELDPEHLTRFLRFCTGSDLLTEKCIEVAFVNVVGLARRPVAHTCSSLLELPKIYENFLQFRSEFIAVLNANIWVMDII